MLQSSLSLWYYDRCTITPRSEERKHVLRNEWKKLSDRVLDVEGNYKANMFE